MLNNDYKNGYNDCIECTIKLINIALKSGVDINSSIGDHLRQLRQLLLNSAYSRFEDSKDE